MEEKKIDMEGNCVIMYRSTPAENREVKASGCMQGTVLDITVAIRSIIEEICREHNIPISRYLKWIENLVMEGISVDVGALEAMEENGYE